MKKAAKNKKKTQSSAKIKKPSSGTWKPRARKKKNNADKKEESSKIVRSNVDKTVEVPKEGDARVQSGDEKPKKNEDSHLAKWTAPSFILTNGEVLIYRVCAIASPFMMIWSVLQGSYIVSITFLLAFCVCVMHLVRKPVAMDCLIDLDGIKMGDKLYKYSLIESFEIDEEAKMLKFKLKNAFLPIKEIYLEDQDPNYIRAVLEYFLPEEKQEAIIINREKKGFAEEDEMTDEDLLSYLDKMEKKIEKEDS